MDDPIKEEKKEQKEQRDVDKLVQDVNSWWGKTFVFIKKTRIKTWKGIFIVAFVFGVAVAVVLTVSFNIESSSNAAEGSALTLFTDDTSITLENGSNIANVDILLNSHENNVVAVKAIVNYDPQHFELQSWDMSNSVFGANNSCSYQGSPCRIISNDTVNGIITVTVAKPSPGISTTSGVIAQLVFRALATTTTSSPNITLDYSTSGGYADSDVILDDGNGTDILSGVQGAEVNVYTAICASFNYSEWGACQSNGTRSRTVLSGIPDGCYGGTPVLQENCTYSGDIPCTAINYSEWSACQPNGTQSRTVLSRIPAGCVGGIEIILEQNCAYQPPTCVSFTYSEWGICQPDGTQTRTILSYLPDGCTGGNPETSRSCTYNKGGGTCVSFTYSEWGICQPDGTQTRTILSSSPTDCTGGNPETSRSCTYNKGGGTCVSFTYSEWGACQSNGTQSRTVVSSLPAGCTGGNPTLSQSCQYVVPVQPKEKEKKKDKEKPKFTDLPLFLNKNRGDRIWWKATDNEGIDYFTYNFNGKKVKTTKKHFLIPGDTKSGVYLLRVKAFDEAGNSKSRLVTIRVK